MNIASVASFAGVWLAFNGIVLAWFLTPARTSVKMAPVPSMGNLQSNAQHTASLQGEPSLIPGVIAALSPSMVLAPIASTTPAPTVSDAAHPSDPTPAA